MHFCGCSGKIAHPLLKNRNFWNCLNVSHFQGKFCQGQKFFRITLGFFPRTIPLGGWGGGLGWVLGESDSWVWWFVCVTPPNFSAIQVINVADSKLKYLGKFKTKYGYFSLIRLNLRYTTHRLYAFVYPITFYILFIRCIVYPKIFRPVFTNWYSQKIFSPSFKPLPQYVNNCN